MLRTALILAQLGALSTASLANEARPASNSAVVDVAVGDPVMEAAKRKARSTLPEYFAIAANPKPTMQGFAVKVGMKAHAQMEFIWVAAVEKKDGKFHGRLANQPKGIPSLNRGDAVTFAEADIVDWMYIEGDRMRGHYTTCALARTPRMVEAFRANYGLDCGAPAGL